MSSHQYKNICNFTASIPQNTTAQVVTDRFTIGREGALNLRIDIEYESATVAAGITAFLQTTVDNVHWTTVGSPKTVALTAAVATYTVKTLVFNIQDSTDQDFMPLASYGRVCVTTGAGDTITLNTVKVTQKW